MTCLQAFGQLPPGRHGVLPSTTALALALPAAHRMVDRVHHHATNVWAATQPAGTACLAETDFFMSHIPNLADGGVAICVQPPYFARRELEERVVSINGGTNRGGSRGANDLTAPPGHHFNIVKWQPLRNGPQRKSIT